MGGLRASHDERFEADYGQLRVGNEHPGNRSGKKPEWINNEYIIEDQRESSLGGWTSIRR